MSVWLKSIRDKHMAELFTSIRCWELRPDNTFIETPLDDDPARYISASRSERGDLAAIYFPVGGEAKVRQAVLKKRLRGEWFNPRNGKRSPAKSDKPKRFRTPNREDCVLLFHDAKK